MSLIGAAAITAGAALAGQATSAYSAGKMNKRAEKFAWNMYDKQRVDSLSDWNMQNAYNSPQAQMQRLKEAGLNPHLVYGTGTPASTADAPRGSHSSAPRYTVPQMDLGSVVQQAMATKQLQSNIAYTDAQTDAVKLQTAKGQFELRAMEEIGQSEFTKSLEAKVVNARLQDTKEINQYKTWLEASYNTATMDIDPNMSGYVGYGSDREMQEIRAVTERAVQAVKEIKSRVSLQGQQHSINEIQKVIQGAEADFVKTLGSTKGAGMALQLLRTILGK